jgi:hypothetical protein
VLAALVSGAAVTGFNIAADVLAHQRGWWHYPGLGDRGFGPLVWYAGAGIGVSGLSLIAWRAHRRWGLSGTIVFLLALAAYGSTRDWTVSHVMRDLIVFGGGAVPSFAGRPAGMRPVHGEPVDSRAVPKNKLANQSRHDDFDVWDYVHRPARIELRHPAIRLGVRRADRGCGGWLWASHRSRLIKLHP